MKNTLFILTIVSLAASGCVITETGSRSEQAPASAYASSDEPYPVLNAYGNWIDVGVYGRVWQPAVMSDWRPYTIGQWVWTDRGWMWDSDEPFGWVVYHYGYWTQIGSLGWVWVPGNDWSPARVNWYTSNDYVGWAPMCPPQASYPEAYQTGYENYWTVVPAPQFTRLNVGAYRTTPPPPRSGTTPPVGRGTAAQRPPDIITIQGATHELIPPRKTEQDQVRVGRRTVARVRVEQDERPAPPAPVYVAPANPDPGRTAPSPITLPGGARTGPRPTNPAVVTPPPVQERTPSPVRITPTPAPDRIVPAPSPVRTAPAPQPARVMPAPAPVRAMPSPQPSRITPAPAPVRVAPPPPPAKAPEKKEERK
jgi:hypothetical protein